VSDSGLGIPILIHCSVFNNLFLFIFSLKIFSLKLRLLILNIGNESNWQQWFSCVNCSTLRLGSEIVEERKKGRKCLQHILAKWQLHIELQEMHLETMVFI
jgi:hypothetical protein